MDDLILLNHLIRLEQALHHPGAPATAEQLASWLHPAFHEVGRSGVPYDRETVVRYLSGVVTPPPTESWGFAVVRLSDSVALLTYQSIQIQPDGQRTLPTFRSSVWVRCAAPDSVGRRGDAANGERTCALEGNEGGVGSATITCDNENEDAELGRWQLRYHQGTPAAVSPA